MSETVACVALIEPSSLNREAIRCAIQAINWAVLDAECSSYDQALAAFASSRLDGAIIGLDDDPERAMQLIEQLTLDYPEVSLAVISSRPEVLVQAHRHGARCLLEFPVQLEHLLGTIRSFGSSHNPLRPPRGRIVSVLSSRGGVGTTTLAANLACTLATGPDRHVVLVDLDLALGAAEIALGLEPEKRLSDLAFDIDQLDLFALKNSLTRHETGVLLLARPVRYQDLGNLHEEHIHRIIRLLQLLSTHMFIDVGKGWQATDMQALHLSDAILLVIQPDLSSVRNAALVIDALAAEQLDGKVYIVMNRVGAYFGKDCITIKKAEEVLNHLVYWQVPNDYKAMMEAWNAGIPLVKMAPTCKAQQAIAGLANDLCKRLDPTEPRKEAARVKQTVVIKPVKI